MHVIKKKCERCGDVQYHEGSNLVCNVCARKDSEKKLKNALDKVAEGKTLEERIRNIEKWIIEEGSKSDAFCQRF